MEGVLYATIKCQQQMGIFPFDVVGFLIFETPTLLLLFFTMIFGMYLVGTNVGRFSLFQ
jgi:hypothetical protein